MSIQNLLLASFLIFCCCKDKNPEKDLSRVLDLAGSNKIELLETLDHFRDDSLKYLAACYLIKNLPNHYTFVGPGLEVYNQFYDLIKPINLNLSLSKKKRIQMIKSLGDSLKVKDVKLGIIPDYQVITSEVLIDNIKHAFYSWKTFPWSFNNLDFDEFCKYVLPYKVLNEPSVIWRKQIISEFEWLQDSLSNLNSLKDVVDIVNLKISQGMYFDNYFDQIPNAISFNNLESGRIGKCDHMVTRNVYYLRALGVPVRVDFTHLWGDGGNGHLWMSIEDESSRLYAFDALFLRRTEFPDFLGLHDQIPMAFLKKAYKAAKIYRRSFASLENEGTIIFELNNPSINTIDVTHEYLPKPVDLRLTIEDQIFPDSLFLNVFGKHYWEPVTLGRKSKNKTIYFKDIGHSIVYLPSSRILNAHDNESNYNPLLLNKDGSYRFLRPDTTKTQVLKLDRKFRSLVYLDMALEEMVGGVFQGSNTRDFSDPTNIFSIATVPEPRTNNYKITSNKKFRYYRFLTQHNLCRVAELRFKGINGNTLDGELISSTYSEFDPPINTLDGDVLTYFVSEDSAGWIGIDLGEGNQEILKSIDFYPPNDGNSVEIGDVYELFFYDKGWVSLGKKQAQNEFLIYDECPTNSLFLLKDLSKGVQERIFTIENGKQVWR